VSYDWNGIAARIRGLIRVQEGGDFRSVAARLGVRESSLRMSIQGDHPLPTVDVLAALVRIYGLDPSWVLTGEYDPATHRTALESNTAEIAVALNNFLAQGSNGDTGENRTR
jgi:transcriptional regulator with XRE-family HTH domain